MKFDGQSVKSMAALQDLLKYYKAGETVELGEDLSGVRQGDQTAAEHHGFKNQGIEAGEKEPDPGWDDPECGIADGL